MSDAYRLELDESGLHATLSSASGERWLVLRPLAAFDALDGVDETLEIVPPREVGDGRFEVERNSTRWDRAVTTIECGEETVTMTSSVSGRGRLTDVRLLGGRTLMPGRPKGLLPSGSELTMLFTPNPEDPARLRRSARERAVIGVVGDGTAGRGHWFFTPAPLCLALTSDEATWLTLAVDAPVEELTFTHLLYEPVDRAFTLTLEYEGHTEVNGEFRAPAVVVRPGVPDPYEGIRRYRADIAAPRPRETPAWWTEPIFCGWGAQCALASAAGEQAAALSTQANYDAFLSHLEAAGVVPGTVVIDDKWQDAYGTCEPDTGKWPDLRGWIDGRHDRGQHVLLWWKAWDPEGLPPELCIRGPGGVPLALDPTSPRARDALDEAIVRMLSSDGLNADGFKVDFTGDTPSGHALEAEGCSWGIALLHELLAIVYAAAKRTKPDALVVTHTPHPAFVDVTDMIRLNDMLRFSDLGPAPRIVPQMQYRAAVVQAACPELLIDTDDWCAPSLEQWRDYVEVKRLLGVPALYYSQSLDFTGERLEPRDYESLRRTWEQWRATPR